MTKVYFNSMRMVVILSLLILSSCGVSGDLYLPDESSKKTPEKSTPSASD